MSASKGSLPRAPSGIMIISLSGGRFLNASSNSIRNINIFTRNKYLNLIILLIEGEVNQIWHGKISRGLFDFLTDRKMIKLFNRRLEFITYLFMLFLKSIIFIAARLTPQRIKRLIINLVYYKNGR